MIIATENPSADIYEAYHVLIRKWYAARLEKPLPIWEDFKNISQELEDHRMLSNLRYDPLDIVYVEAGSTLETLYGSRIVGKNLDELYNNFFRQRALDGYKRVIDEKLPIFEQRGFSTILGNIGYYKLHLPFGGDQIETVATYIMPTSRKFKKRWDWEKFILKTPWLHS